MEKSIFSYVCGLGREITRIMLENYDMELAEKIAMTVTESPYRVTVETISGTCGQSISHGGAWNLIQKLWERVCGEEAHDVERMEAGQAEGKTGIPVLFEEMDGLVFTMQMQEVLQVLSAAKAPKKEGKGNAYVEAISSHVPLMDAMMTASRKTFKSAFCS